MQSTTTAEGSSSFAIVDGQQRIRAILQFIGVESDPQEEEFNKFVLDKLPNTSPWKNKSFADLTVTEKAGFYSYELAVRLLQTESEIELRDMFERLNKYLTPAKPQELRNAHFSGPLVKMVEALANDEYWAENRIVSPQLIRRMGDFEFISELVIGVLHGPQAGSAAVIDEFYFTYEDYDDEFPEQRRARRFFEKTLGFKSIGLEKNKSYYLMALNAIPSLSQLSLNSNGSGNLKGTSTQSAQGTSISLD